MPQLTDDLPRPMPDAVALLAQASKMADEPGPFTEDLVEGADPSHVVKLLNYCTEQMQRRAARSNAEATKLALVFVAIVSFLLGGIVLVTCAWLIDRPLVTAVNRLADQAARVSDKLEKASSVDAVLRYIQDKDKGK